jgi:protein involved in polysaccharide export with SLBB domain
VGEMTNNLITDYELILNHRQGTYRLPVYGKYSVKSFIDLLGLDMTDVDDLATYISPLEDIIVNDSYINMQFTAKKYNTVSFRAPENNLIQVTISGAVDFPGTYTLNNNSTVEDLYQIIGGFKKQANLDGIILTRENIRERQLKSIEIAQNNLNKAILTAAQEGDNIGNIDILMSLSETIDPENLGRLAGNFKPQSTASINTILFDGDNIIVPKFSNHVNVLGEVLNPLAITYTKNLQVNSVIKQAGGYKKYADKRRVYIIKANGIVNKTSRNIFTTNFMVQPGDTVIVPRKIISNNPGIQALVPLTQVLSDLAFTASALDNLTSN